MLYRRFLGLTMLVGVIIFVGCSATSGGLPVTPDQGDVVRALDQGGSKVCLGQWQCVVDPVSKTVEVVPHRQADLILNVLTFMEPGGGPPFWVSFNVIDGGIDWAHINISFEHPFGGSDEYFGFDVRGVCIGPTVRNADGLTLIPNPGDFEDLSQTYFGYLDGAFGTDWGSQPEYTGLNGYKYFCDGLSNVDDLYDFFTENSYEELDNRGVFEDGQTNSRLFDISWAGTELELWEFNYAVYANYDWPTTDGEVLPDPPWELDDYLPTANSDEAFCANFTHLDNHLWWDDTLEKGGGYVSFSAELFDWQGDINSVYLQSAKDDIFETADDNNKASNTATVIDPVVTMWEFDKVKGTPTSDEDVEIIVTVYDEEEWGEIWFFGLLPTTHDQYYETAYNCFSFKVHINERAEWDPGDLELETSELARRTDASTIPDICSSYDSRSMFSFTNNPPFGTTCQYYVYTSNTGLDPDEVDWTEFTPLMSTFTIPWVDYEETVPDILWVWVRVKDTYTESEPVVCEDEIYLSRVIFEADEFEIDFDASPSFPPFLVSWDTDPDGIGGAEPCLIIRALTGTGEFNIAYDDEDDLVDMGDGLNTMEYYIPVQWDSYFLLGSPYDHIHFAWGEDQDLKQHESGICIQDEPGPGVVGEQWDNCTGDKCFGLWVDKDNTNEAWITFLDYPGLYEDPAAH